MNLRRKIKSVAAFLHLWVGLVTGLIVVNMGITGSIYVFQKELFSLFHSSWTHVGKGDHILAVSELQKRVQAVLPAGRKITRLETGGPEESFVFTAQQSRKKEDVGLTYFSQFNYFDVVYIDPYSGRVLGVIDGRYEFFNMIRQMHQHLLLANSIGSPIVGIAVLLFLLILLTGLIIWMPKRIRQFKNSIGVKWKAGRKRVNYDLHRSLGFYVLPFALLIAVTGLVWSFKWWEGGIYRMLGTKKPPALAEKQQPALLSGTVIAGNPADIAFNTVLQRAGNNYLSLGLNLAEKPGKPMMAVVGLQRSGDGWRGLSYYFLDSRTGKLFDSLVHKDKPLGLKWRNSNLDIHSGAIFGWPTKILAFLASLICASLPVTGFYIWWGKRRKE